MTIGLWQVIELFAAGDKLEKKFTPEQLKDLASRATASLSEEEQKLIRSVIGKLNERTLLEKFQKHLENIGLVLSERDQNLLFSKFRRIRNDIEHGKKPEEPTGQEIKRIKALMNRIILTSLAASKKPNQASTP